MFGTKPQKVRDWCPKHGVQSDATEHADGTWTIVAMRNFIYTKDGAAHEAWLSDVPVEVQKVVRLWYLVEPFTDSDAIAHPYFIFENNDGSTLCFTIEGKRLNGAPYSGFKGLTNEYELGYLWITETDCLTMPLTHGGKALYLYPLTLAAHEAQAVCTEFLKDTHLLFEHPEFYNTLTNNCTGRFAHTLRRVGIRAPHDLSWYLPGWSDRYFKRIGLIGPEVTLRAPARDLVARQDEVWPIIESSRENQFSRIFRLLS